MNVPMEWSTRGLRRRDASQAYRATERLLEKVDRRLPRAVACRVAVERDHGCQEREVEGPVRVRVEVTVPSRPPVVAVRHTEEGQPGEGVVPAVHEAFRRILAQLDSAVPKREPARRDPTLRAMWIDRT